MDTAPVDDSAKEGIVGQRREVVATMIACGAIPADPFLNNRDRPVLGIAFSGGGIRSATISLGAIQALAKTGRLFDFDFMSSVSGGGYIASFLGSLFVPQSYRTAEAIRRGDPAGTRPADLAQRCKYAQRVLTQPADCTLITSGEVPPPQDDADRPDYNAIRSPLHWLRENGRYLAPNGASDYASAATYLSRNWLAMIYIFVIAMAVVFWATHVAVAGLVYCLAKWGSALGKAVIDWTHLAGRQPISALLILAPVMLVLAVSAGVAYWSTAILHGFRPKGRTAIIEEHPRIALAVVALVQATVTSGFTGWMTRFPQLDWPPTKAFTATFLTALAWLGITVLGLTALFTLRAAFAKSGNGVAFFASDARRLLTRLTTNLNLALMLVLALGLIDTVGLRFHDDLQEHGPQVLKLIIPALAPAGAWLISKIAGNTSAKGAVAQIVAKYLDAVTLVVGVVLFGGLAVLADTLAHFLIWQQDAWPSPPECLGQVFDYPAMQLGGVALVGLALVTYFSTGFINLSSLHNFYTTRLTRTYLGAANVERLSNLVQDGPAGNIRDSQPQDDIDIQRYQTLRTAAPLHIINVTLNETGGSDDSPLVERDRKGLSLAFAPDGVVLNAGVRVVRPWSEVASKQAEPLSLGQLCAISGAAVSTGMGSYTSLGLALCLTFANARLGYWWQARTLFCAVQPNLGGTYGYLLREMLARFRRDTERIMLSDGGHFENSGAYELLRRKVDVALVLDNGADPDYSFDELADLVRLARLDMALEITVASADDVALAFDPDSRGLFFNTLGDTWRTLAESNQCKAFALLLKVTGTGAKTRWIVWIKPRLGAVRALDIQGYGLAHATFPQESTADQFFNEAQWESYRAMGEDLLETLLKPGGGVDGLRRLAGWTPQPAAPAAPGSAGKPGEI
jgi:hypothetical protein